MHRLILLIAAAGAFGLAPVVSRMGPVIGGAGSIALAILLACAASGGPSTLSLAAGAVGAFGSGVLQAASAPVAGACLVGFAFAERTIRVRDPAAKAAHVAVAIAGGAIAGALSCAYVAGSGALRVVAILVAAVLVALPLLVDADDPIAHALERSALSLRDPVARLLRDGAHLRRHVDAALIRGEARRNVARTWGSLLRLADGRVRLEQVRGASRAGLRVGATGDTAALSAADTVIHMLDQKIADHVIALVRARAAVDTVRAAELGLDDADARSVDAVGETLEDVSRAIVEVKA
jgi:hypothetical protein